jgi:Xaa-Pro aminopeptidase
MLREAAAISDTVFGALAEERFTGRTEVELAWRIRELFHEHGSSELAFDMIVASGENGASPHAVTRDVPIEAGTLVTVDAGCRVGSYASDCTRTFATGELAGLDAIRPGVSGVDADRAARSVIEEAGWGEEFGHGLGHGIGLDVHEAPSLRPESTDTLEPGNLVSCEPGIYIPDLGGVRIEDMVLVTDSGREQLTTHDKQLTVVS